MTRWWFMLHFALALAVAGSTYTGTSGRDVNTRIRGDNYGWTDPTYLEPEAGDGTLFIHCDTPETC